MKTDKILVTVNNLEDVKTLKELDISNFLFPLKNFSIGYKTFKLEDLEDLNVNVYLLVNRLLTDDDIEEFLHLQIPSFIRGIVLEDVGLYYALKDKPLELINFQNHLNNSSETVNFWLEYYDSLVLSTDITYEEIKKIVDNSKKALIVNTFGYPMIMYSRRHLLKNLYEHKGETAKEKLDASIPGTIELKMIESEYGTAVFDDHILDIREEASKLDEKKIKFYLFNSCFLDIETIKKAVKNEKIENTTKGFLNKKTIYRIGDIE